jgi:phosphoglucomutase
MGLLGAEITARTGKDPGEHYDELTTQFGEPYYTRIDAPATPEQKAVLQRLAPEVIKAQELGGEPILTKMTHAPGNGEPIGGLIQNQLAADFPNRPELRQDLAASSTTRHSCRR